MTCTSTPKCDACPLSGDCRSYPRLCELYAQDPERYRAILDTVNGEQPAVYPPIATQLGNAVKAAARFVQSGFETVDQAEFDRRRAICLGCDRYDAEQDRCWDCGCALALKPWSRAEACPLGRWEQTPDAVERGGAPSLLDDHAGA